MFTEDLAAFFDTADFADDATWSVGPATVQVIFDREYLASLGIASRDPIALVRDAQLPTVAKGQTLVIRGVTYTILSVEPDGTGLSLLQLQS